MKNIVILGCENSHANMFLDYIRDNSKYKDINVLGVYSDDPDASRALNKKYGVKIMDSYDQYIAEADGVIITARHGDNHYKYANPYMQNGKTMFIDKPITVSEADAILLVKAAIKSGVKLTGGSCLCHVDWVKKLKADRENNVDGNTLGGFLRCPVNLKNPYGDFFFYSQHLIETTQEIFGRHPKSVKAFLNGGNLSVVFRYDTFDVTGLFIDQNYSCYYAMRVSENYVVGSEFPINENSECFKLEFDEFYELLNGNTEQRLSFKDFIAPVFVMNAVNRSLQSGNEEIIKEYEL